jgi:hypothetical protein
MSYIQIPDYVFDNIIKNLQQGYDVCVGVDYSSDETEKRPEYATGYSRATMRGAIEQLKCYKEQSN